MTDFNEHQVGGARMAIAAAPRWSRALAADVMRWSLQYGLSTIEEV